MAQKPITVYTPISQEPHIMATDDAFIFADFAGIKSGILGALVCVAQNSTTARLTGGGAINRGHVIRIPNGDVLVLSLHRLHAMIALLRNLCVVMTMT